MAQVETQDAEVAAHRTDLQGTWQGDTAHSSIEFVARYLMATKVRGTVAEWTATLNTSGRPEEATVEVSANAASITTHNEQRDAHLRGSDFFDVEKYPTIEFRSTSVGPVGDDNRFQIEGDLTTHGETHPVTLDVEFMGVATDPYQRTKANFSATTTIEREKWGLNWNQALETGGFLVSKKITLEIEIQFVLQK